MNDSPVRLDDKFSLSKDRIILNGSQALVRLCLLQAERDRQAGLKTGGYVSGYRGSPLGGVDQQFHRAGEELAAAGVVFEPGLNEDLAATMACSECGTAKVPALTGPETSSGTGISPVARETVASLS